MSLYEYCRSAPWSGVDPYGNWFGIDDVFTGPIDELIVLGTVASAICADQILYHTVPAYHEPRDRAVDRAAKKIDEVIDDVVKAVKNIGKGPRGPKNDPTPRRPPVPKPPVPKDTPPGPRVPVRDPARPLEPYPPEPLGPGDGVPPLRQGGFGRGYGWDGWDDDADGGGGGTSGGRKKGKRLPWQKEGAGRGAGEDEGEGGKIPWKQRPDGGEGAGNDAGGAGGNRKGQDNAPDTAKECPESDKSKEPLHEE